MRGYQRKLQSLNKNREIQIYLANTSLSIRATLNKLDAYTKVIVGKRSKHAETFVNNDLKMFKREADTLLANKKTDDLTDLVDKLYVLDLFGDD